MKRGAGGRAVAGVMIVALAVLLLVLILSVGGDPLAKALELWRLVRFPFGFVLGGLALATVFDRRGD